ncbi:hypothetical protein ACJX0J_024687 [Zea mays]
MVIVEASILQQLQHDLRKEDNYYIHVDDVGTIYTPHAWEASSLYLSSLCYLLEDDMGMEVEIVEKIVEEDLSTQIDRGIENREKCHMAKDGRSNVHVTRGGGHMYLRLEGHISIFKEVIISSGGFTGLMEK